MRPIRHSHMYYVEKRTFYGLCITSFWTYQKLLRAESKCSVDFFTYLLNNFPDLHIYEVHLKITYESFLIGSIGVQLIVLSKWEKKKFNSLILQVFDVHRLRLIRSLLYQCCMKGALFRIRSWRTLSLFLSFSGHQLSLLDYFNIVSLFIYATLSVLSCHRFLSSFRVYTPVFSTRLK